MTDVAPSSEVSSKSYVVSSWSKLRPSSMYIGSRSMERSGNFIRASFRSPPVTSNGSKACRRDPSNCGIPAWRRSSLARPVLRRGTQRLATGTAQVISLQGAKVARGKIDVRDHGWFVFFAPKDNPEIAGVIFGEHNEHGYLGAPIAKHVIETTTRTVPRESLPPPGTGSGHSRNITAATASRPIRWCPLIRSARRGG